nr:flagellar basal body-associated FliL family protein [Deltaproteobacteria bacterium]
MTQDASNFKGETDYIEDLELKITKPLEDSGDNGLRTDADLTESMGNDFDMTLSEDESWDEKNHLMDIRLFDSHDEPDKKELTIHKEKTVPQDELKAGLLQKNREAKLLHEASWIIWTISGASGILLIIGLALLWNLSAPFFEPHGMVTEDIRHNLPNHSASETIDLAPFLIPVQRDKELVFLKLQVELIVSDAETKNAIRKKEAWIRDTISRRLKGIDISSGIQEESLKQYGQPIIRCLNHDLAPLRVKDVRLRGHLMK